MEQQDRYGIHYYFLNTTCKKYKAIHGCVFVVTTNVFPMEILFFFFWTNKCRFIPDLSVSASQWCCCSTVKLWLTAKVLPSSSGRCWAGKRRMSLRRLRLLWTLISWLQALTPWIMLFVPYPLLDGNGFVSKRCFSGQSSKIKSSDMAHTSFLIQRLFLWMEWAGIGSRPEEWTFPPLPS